MAKTPTVLTVEETDRILNAIKYPKGNVTMTYKSFRNHLLTLFMLDAGLRVSEVVQLKRHMIWKYDTVVSALEVPAEIAKIHHSRIIPLTERLRNEIELLRVGFWVCAVEEPLFYVFFTKKPDHHITARRVQQIVKKASLATIGRNIWPHVFRHTFANRLMGVTNIRIVQELLGHKNLTSTQIYTHPNSQDLLNAINGMT